MQNPSIDRSGYRGNMRPTSLGRDMLDIQKLWNKEPLKNPIIGLDALIATQLEHAKENGQKKVTVLDIGSGTGNLFRTALRGVLFNTRQFLADNPDFSVNLIGITDPAGLEEIGYPVEEKGTDLADGPGQTIDGRLTATNYSYTIDSTNSLSHFLQEQGIEQVNLVLATRSLMYFHPRIFKRTLEEIATDLAPGGRFIMHGYSDEYAAGEELSVDKGVRRGKPSLFTDLLEQIKATTLLTSQRAELTAPANISKTYQQLAPTLSKFVLQFLDSKSQKQDTDQTVRLFVAKLQRDYEHTMREIAQSADTAQALPLGKIEDTVYAIQSALHIIHLIKLRRIKTQILDEFATAHSNLEIEKGNILVSMVKKPEDKL